MVEQITKEIVKTHQEDGMSLKSSLPGGFVNLDLPVESGGNGNGVKPKPLMLSALAGCTSMDVISLLKKMKITYNSFDVNVTADLTNGHPRFFNKVTVEYIFSGNDLNKEKIKRAVELSFEKYCGVIYMFKQFADVSYTITYE